MTRPQWTARSLDRVVEIARTAQDSRMLRLLVLEELRRVVGFDAYAWLLTDPETSVGSAPLADVPSLAELPALIRLKYLTPVNRWTGLSASGIGLLQQATGGDLSRSLLWRDLLSRYDVTDVASLVFRDRFGCWAFLDLWRIGTPTPFTETDAAFLSAVTGAVTTGLRRCQAGTFVARPDHHQRRVGPVVLLLSPSLTVLAQTPETEAYLRLIVPPAPDRSPIPASAYNVAAQLLAVEADVDRHLPTARLHLSDGLWVTLRAGRIGDQSTALDRDIAVTIEETSPPERLALFARAFGLTPRETELLGRLGTGIDTRDVADQMFVSQNTIQDHLKSIFAKTATHTRPTLLSRALGS